MLSEHSGTKWFTCNEYLIFYYYLFKWIWLPVTSALYQIIKKNATYKGNLILIINLCIQTVAMILVLLAIALVCVFHGNLDLSNSKDDLTNVAYSKSVRLSSYVSRWYYGFHEVNGMFSDFILTLLEKAPWLRIDLGARYQIHEIEVFARIRLLW